MDLWVVGPDGKATSSRFGPGAQYTVLPPQFPPPGGPRTVPPPGGLLWTGIVPDGVGMVRWTFVCNRLARNCTGQRAITLTVPVRNNIATTQVPGSRRCGATPASCLHPSTVTWYGAFRQVVARYTAASVIAAPPFVLRKPAPPPPGISPKPAPPRQTLRVLSGIGIGALHFGAALKRTQVVIDRLLGEGSVSHGTVRDCGVDRQITWSDQWSSSGQPSLTVYFQHGRLIGYEYGDAGAQVIRRLPAHGPLLETQRGLTIDDTFARGRRLYGSAFETSAAQGGSWRVNTKSGPLDGYASGVPSPGNLGSVKVKTIDAGNVGCPALSP
jgi:hypothetical protein